MLYVIFTAPAVIPVTIPVVLTTVALEVVLLLQVPHDETSDKVIAEPTQTVTGPDIDAGAPFTVTMVVAFAPQPVL